MSRHWPNGAEIIGLRPLSPVEQAVLDVVAEREPIAPLELFEEVRRRTGACHNDARIRGRAVNVAAVPDRLAAVTWLRVVGFHPVGANQRR